jgi:hypothetical protein
VASVFSGGQGAANEHGAPASQESDKEAEGEKAMIKRIHSLSLK